ncbi:SPFH domain-containing protein [Flagellimonas zhangzhouensis]|uniref:Membrane protease subunit, stomatin/prohibitin family, contains C-terminal Zn-ribbon domain n=1 Tax=Flagellimonas zhangzhouensis TaxID=1073328 RepID=A0A1H2UI13_9FLAO|nr:SPFH domain-containing protein [Allomuricauda zhangzhouensis]SDQ16852.1 Membrane protease subunit, stomatin/prohibitin family, contains C-terminal Zn-ribbon domain [Allomuricauda zhangzhouensis]SDW55752.1 Membrane protease subunit, stomatin/prohibitin family, contains C-terminal Zn-ribbon domain [Allomuricauda zhangzhouensis]
MDIFGKIKEKLSNEFIDIIEWLDYTDDTIAFRFERYQNEIKNGAKLIVREGQTAVFINEGQLADVFEPGTYDLTTQNLPILATLKGWKYGFNSPFKAEVYFVNTHLFTDEKWGTKSPITLSDDRFGLVEIRAFGTYAYKISDAGKFIKDIVGTDSNFTNFEINEHLKSLIATRFTNTVGQANLPIELYAANTTELSDTCREVMSPEFESVGISLEKFYIENVSMPEDLKKEIFEYSRIDKLDLDKLTKFKTAKAIEAAAQNEGGTAGAGMGMGMGFVLAQQMGGMMGGNTQAAPQQAAQPTGGTVPPPMPTQTQYFYASNGVQHGPVGFEQMQSLFASRAINRDSLVWKQGMSAWTALKEVEELKSFLGGNTPPPLPTE